jgi:two-component system cell cycle response regulator CpdR
MSRPENPAGDPTTRRRVLLVEDNDASGQGLGRLLEIFGFEVRVVPDGTSALTALAESPPPDFLLTDLQLPDLDGRELAQHARQLSPAPRVALITGWDPPTEPDETARWGIDWVFTKPVDIAVLVAKLREASVAPRG